MIQLLKNIGVGFLVSFIGSLPLGYLNLVGFEVWEESGTEGLTYYLLGVISIEVFVIYFTLIFAEKLAAKKKLIKSIELFSILFMLLLAVIFYSKSQATHNTNYLSEHPDYSPFWLGVTLNCVNFIQLPFWVGWNLYVINAGFISTKKSLKYYYVAGTLAGTFLGMLLFVMSLNLVMTESGSFSAYIVSYIIPLLFIGFALFQAIRYYKKYYSVGTLRK